MLNKYKIGIARILFLAECLLYDEQNFIIMENNNNFKKLGDDYRDCIRALPIGNFMFPIDIMTYLRGYELQVFIFISSSINKYDKCNETFDEIADYLRLSGISIKRALTKLKAIGLITNIRGFHTTTRDIDYVNLVHLSNILYRNPGIGSYLRDVMGDRDISEISGKEILMANRLYNDEHGIKNKTRHIEQVNEQDELIGESVFLF